MGWGGICDLACSHVTDNESQKWWRRLVFMTGGTWPVPTLTWKKYLVFATILHTWGFTIMCICLCVCLFVCVCRWVCLGCKLSSLLLCIIYNFYLKLFKVPDEPGDCLDMMRAHFADLFWWYCFCNPLPDLQLSSIIISWTNDNILYRLLPRFTQTLIFMELDKSSDTCHSLRYEWSR